MATSHIPLASLERKKINGRFAPTIPECQCKHCGVTYRPKRKDRVHYCSRECGHNHRKMNAQSPEDKSAKAIARYALKRKHYEPRSCAICAASFIPITQTQTKCSDGCRVKHNREQARLRHMARSIVDKSTRPCAECNKYFTPEYGEKHRLYCSRLCRKRHTKRPGRIMRKAKVRLATVEHVNPFRVFDRDKWTCQLCGCPTPMQLRGTYSASAPEVDHIMPIARGGDHSYANTQCACRACNAAKSDTFAAHG